MDTAFRYLPLYLVFAALLGTLLPRLLQPVAAAMLLLAAAAFVVPPAVSSDALERWLETRYDRSGVDALKDPAGILIAGGGLATYVVDEIQGNSLDDRGRAGRISGAVALARRFPAALVVHTGREPMSARDVLVRLGVAPDRIVIEDQSSTTAENAAFAAAKLAPRAGQRWILVTSAVHMPRAMATFRTAGFDVVAYPVDFRSFATRPRSACAAGAPPVACSVAVRELVAIVGYVVSGAIRPWYLLR